MKTKLVKSTNNPFLRLYGNLVSGWTIRLLEPRWMDDSSNIFSGPLSIMMNHSLRYADFYEVVDWELSEEDIRDAELDTELDNIEYLYDEEG